MKDNPGLGVQFEREIREQPDAWERLAASDKAQRLADAMRGDAIVLVGSGSSLFAAQLGALALRRRGINAQALAATEARLDYHAYEGKTVVAVSQSGRSDDLLDALEVLRPGRLIALTNTPASLLATRAHVVIDIDVGPELAVPASKSVSATAALLLWAASIVGARTNRNPDVLTKTAQALRTWLTAPEAYGAVVDAGGEIALRGNVVTLGSDYGLPIASEAALKLKEASYLHAEGFAAGEFRHGSIAMIDERFVVIGFVDADALPVVARPMRELRASGASLYTIGSARIDDIAPLGPQVQEPFNTLAWLATAQMTALHAARARGVDSDAPRGLVKTLVDKPLR
jgi:glucosamine--fructose-6-phosphate aminotransferase (isomerizing)